MARTRLADLPLVETLDKEELERLFGAGPRNRFRPGLEGLEARELYAANLTSSALLTVTPSTDASQPQATTQPATTSSIQIDTSALQTDSATVGQVAWSQVGDYKQVAIGNNADGSQEAFAVSADGKSTYYNTTLTNGVWDPAGWHKLTTMSNPPTIKSLALTRGADNNAQPYALDDCGTVYELAAPRDTPTHFFWSPLARTPDGGADHIALFHNPATNRETIYAVSENRGFVYEMTQKQPGDWSAGGWSQLDRGSAQPQEVQAIRVTTDYLGNPLVVAITRDQPKERVLNTIKVFAVVQNPSDARPFGQWVDLGLGNATSKGAASLTLTRDPASGGLLVSVLGNDGHIYESWYAPGARPTSQAWQEPWTDLAKLQSKLPAMTNLRIGRDLNGSLEVFALGKDNKIYRLQLPPLGANGLDLSTANWQSYKGPTVTVVQNKKFVQVAANVNWLGLHLLPDGTLQVLAFGTDAHGKDVVWSTTETTPGGNLSWTPINY